MSEHIDIVFDGPPSHESGRFVEVEDSTGASISIGDWVQRDEFWCLRIPDFRKLEAERDKLLKKNAELLAHSRKNALQSMGLHDERDELLAVCKSAADMIIGKGETLEGPTTAWRLLEAAIAKHQETSNG